MHPVFRLFKYDRLRRQKNFVGHFHFRNAEFTPDLRTDGGIQMVSKSWKEGRQCRKMQSLFSVAFITSPVTL